MLSVVDSETPFFGRTRLPTEHGEFDVRVYRGTDQKEHLAISVGDLTGAEDLVTRVHSECLTGEVLGSLKCDCKAQLNAALRYVQEKGRGLVIYLRQEGRGIGLGNKIRAYRLQEQGADTVEANRILGFADDLRDYAVAARMLRALEVRSVHLLTNNPLKLEGLVDAGIEVTARIPLVAGANAVNVHYLETKRTRMGHLYESLEAEDADAEARAG